MTRVLCNVQSQGWAIHFIGPDGTTRVGPWLLFNSHDEVRAILAWADISPEELVRHERSIEAWGCSSVVLFLADVKFRVLIRRAIGWPWNGYELEQMRKAGTYPPARLDSTS